MPYHLSIYHDAKYPISSQFSCFCEYSQEFQSYKQITIYLQILCLGQFVTLQLQIPVTERGHTLVIFQICQAVQRERHICMPISTPHIVLTGETLPLIFKKNKSIHANETITQNRILTGEIHHGNEISI